MRSARPFFVSSIFSTTLPISPSVIISPFLFSPPPATSYPEQKKEGREEIECNNRERREKDGETKEDTSLSHFLFLFSGPTQASNKVKNFSPPFSFFHSVCLKRWLEEEEKL